MENSIKLKNKTFAIHETLLFCYFDPEINELRWSLDCMKNDDDIWASFANINIHPHFLPTTINDKSFNITDDNSKLNEIEGEINESLDLRLFVEEISFADYNPEMEFISVIVKGQYDLGEESDDFTIETVAEFTGMFFMDCKMDFVKDYLKNKMNQSLSKLDLEEDEVEGMNMIIVTGDFK